ncbi:hypothetical protein VTJ49DRAFT_2788 [Mycothermus thermophilus]|uniref:Uncharacterized protein n=1 Tax=Humicola insolens TaxID=85995 RepID=A0ABR3V9F1_HUMIN
MVVGSILGGTVLPLEADVLVDNQVARARVDGGRDGKGDDDGWFAGTSTTSMSMTYVDEQCIAVLPVYRGAGGSYSPRGYNSGGTDLMRARRRCETVCAVGFAKLIKDSGQPRSDSPLSLSFTLLGQCQFSRFGIVEAQLAFTYQPAPPSVSWVSPDSLTQSIKTGAERQATHRNRPHQASRGAEHGPQRPRSEHFWRE